jgi:hypothetical protein
LQAVEQAAGDDELLRGRLDVENSGTGGHPLGRAVVDDAAAAVGVLVLEGAVDHVGDGLEAAVRVPARALGLAGRVIHFAHLVHVDERVQVSRRDARERAHDREALALVAPRPSGDLTNRALGVTQRGRGDAGQCQRVGRDGRHRNLLSSCTFNCTWPQRLASARHSPQSEGGTLSLA